MSVRIYIPGMLGPSADAAGFGATVLPASWQGISIGLLDNSKPNAGVLLQSVVSRLEDQIPGITHFAVRKPNAAVGISDLAFGKLADESSVVLVGSAD